MVMEELKLLQEDTEVYKMIGPTLVKQELSDARNNVEKRIKYFTTEQYAKQYNINFVDNVRAPLLRIWKNKKKKVKRR
jgi:hypothetical protein